MLADTEFEVQQPAPETPKVVSISPQDGDKNADPRSPSPPRSETGTTSLKSDSVKLTLDGKAVDAKVTAGDEGFNTITFTGEGLFVAGSNHRFMLKFADDGEPATSESVSVEIDVAAYVELELPKAIYFENFDSVEEFKMPDGWGVNLSQEINAELEPEDFTSAYYEGWVNVAATRWSNSGSARKKATQPAPPIFVNGTRQVLTGNALVADSASRNGHFLTFVYTKDFHLSNHKDVHLGFYSHHAQNQDSSGSGYSIDEGETWLPIVYMLDQADILRDDEGNVDAVTTLEQEDADIAVGYDPDTFEEVGGYYGAYIGAEISEALAPYISGRINDNQTESKRYELFRLPEADGEKTVRFRLAKSGTYSWYWGIDNFGLYSIAPSSMPEVVEASPAAGSQGANPMPLLTFVIKNGEAKLDPISVKLEFNSTEVEGITVTEIKIGAEDGYQVTYQVTDLLEPLSQNSFKLTYDRRLRRKPDGHLRGELHREAVYKRTLPHRL